jgi:hypothetical protein
VKQVMGWVVVVSVHETGDVAGCGGFLCVKRVTWRDVTGSMRETGDVAGYVRETGDVAGGGGFCVRNA